MRSLHADRRGRKRVLPFSGAVGFAAHRRRADELELSGIDLGRAALDPRFHACRGRAPKAQALSLQRWRSVEQFSDPLLRSPVPEPSDLRDLAGRIRREAKLQRRLASGVRWKRKPVASLALRWSRWFLYSAGIFRQGLAGQSATPPSGLPRANSSRRAAG